MVTDCGAAFARIAIGAIRAAARNSELRNSFLHCILSPMNPEFLGGILGVLRVCTSGYGPSVQYCSPAGRVCYHCVNCTAGDNLCGIGNCEGARPDPNAMTVRSRRDEIVLHPANLDSQGLVF